MGINLWNRVTKIRPFFNSSQAQVIIKKQVWILVFAMLIIFAPSGFSVAQHRATLQGYVEEKESDTTLPGAHVFLANTSIGDITDTNGQFAIDNIPAGSYQLLVTMIGYKPHRQVIELTKGETITLALALEKDIYEVGQITVEENQPKGWKRDLNKFRRLFLGRTPNRKGCEIINPHILDFKDDNGFFKASAQEPLIIENRSLGYRITYLLGHFSSGFGEYRYQGEPVFEQLEPKNTREAKRWKERRAQTYEGSFSHFLRSLASGTAYEEGFRTYLIDELIWTKAERDFLQYSKKNDTEIDPNQIVVPGDAPYERKLIFHDYLHVRYVNQSMQAEFFDSVQLNYSPSKEAIRSAIELLNFTAVFNEIGFLNNSYDVGRFGYWGWEGGICNLLPFDYNPDSLQ